MDHPERLIQRRDGGADDATAPVRRFDATVGAITAKEHVADEETEDLSLTDYLMRAWLELNNPHSTPVPRCPYCDGLRIRPDAGKPQLVLFFCHACKKSFNRFTGTPFAKLKGREKGTAMIPLLSRQMSMQQAGERLGRTQKAILSWLLAFRRYLLELDPEGRWEAKVRLGVRLTRSARAAGLKEASIQAVSIRRDAAGSVAPNAAAAGCSTCCKAKDRRLLVSLFTMRSTRRSGYGARCIPTCQSPKSFAQRMSMTRHLR